MIGARTPSQVLGDEMLSEDRRPTRAAVEFLHLRQMGICYVSEVTRGSSSGRAATSLARPRVYRVRDSGIIDGPAHRISDSKASAAHQRRARCDNRFLGALGDGMGTVRLVPCKRARRAVSLRPRCGEGVGRRRLGCAQDALYRHRLGSSGEGTTALYQTTAKISTVSGPRSTRRPHTSPETLATHATTPPCA